MMNKTFEKYKAMPLFKLGDLFILLIFLAGVITGMYFLLKPQDKGVFAEVYFDDKLVGNYDLSEEQEFEVNEVQITIKNNNIQVEYSTCPDKICQKTGAISHVGECIVCLPNRVLIIIKGISEVDYIT